MARMAEIHNQLAQKIRQMLRESLQKHQKSHSMTSLSDVAAPNPKSRTHGDTLSPKNVEEQSQQVSKLFNSFVEPAYPCQEPMVEKTENCTKRFASSIKKPPRLDLIASNCNGPLFGENSLVGPSSLPSESQQNFQVSMPSSLKRKLEIRSYNEAKENFFKVGFSSMDQRKKEPRSSLLYTWSIDQQTQEPDILYESELPSFHLAFKFTNLFTFENHGHICRQTGKQNQTKITGMQANHDQTNPTAIGNHSSLNPISASIESPDHPLTTGSPPQAPELLLNSRPLRDRPHFHCNGPQQDSSGQTLQGDYLSPEYPSVVLSNISQDKLDRMGYQTSGGKPLDKQVHFQQTQQLASNTLYAGFQLLKCSSRSDNPAENLNGNPQNGANDCEFQKSPRELQDEIECKPVSANDTNLYLITESEGQEGFSPLKTLSQKMKTASSSLSTLQGMASSRSQMQEFKNIYQQILLDQNAEAKQKCGISATQIIPTLDFGKIEEIRQKELQESSSNNQESNTQSHQIFNQIETFGKKERKEELHGAHNSRSQQRTLQNSLSQQEGQSLITYRSQSHNKDGLSGLHVTNGGTSDDKMEQQTQLNQTATRLKDGKIPFSRPMSSAAHTPDLISFTQSDLGKNSQHCLDNQEYLFSNPNEIVFEGNEHDDETHSSNENKNEGRKQSKKPFDYDSTGNLIAQFRHRSQQSQNFETALENAIDQKRQHFNQTVHENSKDKENSNEQSGQNTPKDSFVYSNSTQTAALNSQGPAQSNSKTPNIFKSSPYTTTPLEQQSQMLLNQDAQTQKQSISQFLTHSDQHMTAQSFSKVHSLQSSMTNSYIQGVPGPIPKVQSSSSHHHPSQSHELPKTSSGNVVDKAGQVQPGQFAATQMMPSSFVLLQKKLEAATKQTSSGQFSGAKFLQDTLSRNLQASRYSSDGTGAIGSQKRAHWRTLNKYSHSAYDHNISDDVAQIQKGARADSINKQGSFVGKINFKNQLQGHEHKAEAFEVGKSSRQNLQSISFNISSSMQSSPRSNLAFMNKIATSSNLFPSQHSIGASSETQPVTKQNQSNQSPSRSQDNTDKTLNSIQVPSTISHLHNDVIQVESQPQSEQNQSKGQIKGSKSPFDVRAKVFKPLNQPFVINQQNQGYLQNNVQSGFENPTKQSGIMSQDLMAKVRMRKNKILGKEQQPMSPSVHEGEDKQIHNNSIKINSSSFQHTPSSKNQSSHQKNDSSQYWNTNVKDWSPIEYSNFGMSNNQHQQNYPVNSANQIPGQFDYNNKNNYYKSKGVFGHQNKDFYGYGLHGSVLSNLDHHKTQKSWTPNSKNRSNDGSFQDPYSRYRAPGEHQSIRRSAPQTQKNEYPSAFPEPHQVMDFQQQNQSKSSLSNYTQSIKIDKSTGNVSSPQKQQIASLHFSPQIMKKQPSRQISRHRKRWSDGNNQPPKVHSVKFSEEDKIDGSEILRRTQQKRTNNAEVGQGTSLGNRDLDHKSLGYDACSTGETPQKKKKVAVPGGGAADQIQDSLSLTGQPQQNSESSLPQPPPTGSSSKQHKSGEKRSKRQLPPLAQRKSKADGNKGSKLSQSHNIQSKTNPSKTFGFSKQTMTAEEKNKQIQEISIKLAQIKKKQFHLPLTSNYKHGSIFQSQRGASSGGLGGSVNQLRLNSNKGKLLEVMSNNSSQRVAEKDKSKAQASNGMQDQNGMKHYQLQGSSQEGIGMQNRPLVWKSLKSNSLSVKRSALSKPSSENQPKSLPNTNVQQPVQKPINHSRFKFGDEEDKQDSYRQQTQPFVRPASTSSDVKMGLSRLSFGMALQKSQKDRIQRPGTQSVDNQQISEKKAQDQNRLGQSEPQLAMQRKLQAMKQKKLTLVTNNNNNPTTYSSSNQSDNLSTFTDDTHELAELTQYFEAHFARVSSKPTLSQSGANYTHIENKILRTIKDLGEVHYLPVKHIHTSHFLTGVKIINCEVVGQEVLVRVGGGYESLKHFVKANSRNYQRQITSAMRKSGRGINWVVDQFVLGQKHKINSQKSAVVAPAVTSPGRNRLYQIGPNGLPLQSPTAIPSVPNAKFATTDEVSGQPDDGFLQLNHLLLPHDQSPLSRNSLFFSRNRHSSGSFKFPRSPAAANRTLQGPLRSKPIEDVINKKQGNEELDGQDRFDFNIN